MTLVVNSLSETLRNEYLPTLTQLTVPPPVSGMHLHGDSGIAGIYAVSLSRIQHLVAKACEKLTRAGICFSDDKDLFVSGNREVLSERVFKHGCVAFACVVGVDSEKVKHYRGFLQELSARRIYCFKFRYF